MSSLRCGTSDPAALQRLCQPVSAAVAGRGHERKQENDMADFSDLRPRNRTEWLEVAGFVGGAALFAAFIVLVVVLPAFL
ncbi:hypothetical protein HKD21_12490 [Gluconobacter cerevisiae]|uniref:Uncharacterized protein n=1 Tax=Gluconobacter cerevisiae TaxID=1379734 RepID=A0ABR9YG57_9PROT|nr:hypothetical protein [Gluconobacter cerevisiae]